MKPRVEFRLTMPERGSWDGGWVGEGRNYTIIRSLSAEEVDRLGIPTSWSYHWNDGWCASISARFMEKGERRSKSDGFCGYDWMVNNIIRWGTPHCQHEMIPDSTDGWERCRWCSMTRRKEMT